VARFEQELHTYFKANHPELLARIPVQKWKELEAEVRAAVDAFKKGYGQRAAANQ